MMLEPLKVIHSDIVAHFPFHGMCLLVCVSVLEMLFRDRVGVVTVIE